MEESLILEAYGRVVKLTGPKTAVQSARSLLPPSFTEAAQVPERAWSVIEYPEGWRIYESDEHIVTRTPVSAAVNHVLSMLELWVAEHAREVIFLHAGCVEVDGRAIVLPGYTLSGKTTLTAALVRAGARYLSDEYAILDVSGSVSPYPRPLSLREENGHTVTRIEPSSLGSVVAEAPIPVGLFALLHVDADAGWNVSQLSRVRGILELLSQTVPAQSRAVDATAAIARATETASIVQGTRGDADEAAAKLIELLRA